MEVTVQKYDSHSWASCLAVTWTEAAALKPKSWNSVPPNTKATRPLLPTVAHSKWQGEA